MPPWKGRDRSPLATSPTFWNTPAADLLTQIESAPKGLQSAEAAKRLLQYGPNTLRARKRTDTFTLLLRQFKSPIILILVFAAILSLVLKDRVDAGIILGIVLVSGLLSFWQERGATDAVEKLLAIVQVKATVLRDGKSVDIPVEEVVPGDVVLLNGRRRHPGDCLLLESNELFADEATLTGETYPVEKQPGVLPADTPLAKRTNSLFMGTHVVSGSATAVVVHTAKDTEFGQVSERLRLRAAETEFEHGVRRFGYFLGEVTLVLVIIIFGINVYLHRPVLDSFLFSMALAVGLTPQLLPAIISINLAHGAKRMAAEKVIVKRLAAIENLGSMNVLCSDKTGTLTEGEVRLHAALDANGTDSDRVLLFAYLNAFYETGFAEPHRRRHQELQEARRVRVQEAGGGPLRLPAQTPEHPREPGRRPLHGHQRHPYRRACRLLAGGAPSGRFREDGSRHDRGFQGRARFPTRPLP